MTTKVMRKIVHIDEEKCDGCGVCIPACVEGALQIVDGKARLISEVYCDGLGACLGTCPRDAITIEEREAEDFDEEATEKHMHELEHAGESLPCGCPSTTVTQFAKAGAPCGCQSANVARFLEEKGFSTVVLTMTPEFTRQIGIPRVVAIEYPYGRPIGQVHDVPGQRDVL